MALAGVAAVGFLVTALAGDKGLLQVTRVPSTSRWGFALTLIGFGLSAGFALGHRYVSSDSMACHIRLLRMRLRGRSKSETDQEQAARNRRLKLSGTLLCFSAVFLAIGALSLVVAFIGLLNKLS